MGFFDLSDRYASLDAKRDPLVKMDAIVPWDDFVRRLSGFGGSLYRRYLGEARAQRAKALRAWCDFNREANQNSRNELKLQSIGEHA